MNEAILAIRRFIPVLDELEIDYYIGGSIASIVYGRARTTRDVDFVITIDPSMTENFVERLQQQFYADIVAAARSVSTGECFNVLDLETIFQVDVFTPFDSPWNASQMARRQIHQLGFGGDSVEVFLASPEDVLLHKLLWYRLGNEVSRLQWEDALGVLEVQGKRLDDEYLDRWAPALDLRDLLDRARSKERG